MSTKPDNVKLTQRVIDHADLSRRHYLWDSELRGFGVQVEKTGTKTYFVRYRPKGHGRDGVRRFYKLGRHGEFTPDEARTQAKAVLGQIAEGSDPAADRAADREDAVNRRDIIPLDELGRLFMREHVAVKREPKTGREYQIALSRHVQPALGNRAAGAVTRSDILKLHLAMNDTPYSANRVLAVLSSLHSFAAKRGLVPEGFNPAKGIEKYREEGRERYLTSDELEQLGTALIEAETIGIPWDIDTTNPKSKHTP